MAMSLFSLFDAFCAESLGHKVNSSMGERTVKPNSGEEGVLDFAVIMKKQRDDQAKRGAMTGGNSSSPAQVNHGSDLNRKGKQIRKKTPRFAPELDGVHCFETIVPY